MGKQNGPPRQYVAVFAAILGVAIISIAFDILRKTVFINAWWNYDYPATNFVYDPLAVAVFVTIGIVTVGVFPRLLTIKRRHFILALYLFAIGLSVAAFLATPLKSARWASPDSSYYYAAMFAAENGPITYFSDFHALGTGTGLSPMDEAAILASHLQSATFLPGNAEMAEYASRIKVNKHGPIPPLLVSVAIVVLGKSATSATVGSYLITTTIPVIAYFVYFTCFSERGSRIGALLVLFAPAYLIYQRFGAVAWDGITAFLLALSLYFFLRGIKDGREKSMILAGMIFSLAALSKMSAVLFGLFVLLCLAWVVTDQKQAIAHFFRFGLASLVIPVTLLFVGYNTLIQFLFTITRATSTTSTGKSATAAAGYLSNPILFIAGPLYNGRLLGPALIVLASFAVITILIYFRRNPGSVQVQHQIAIAIFVSLLPFILVIPGRTISRHMLPYLVSLGYIAVSGLTFLEINESALNRMLQVAFILTLALALVNI